MSTKLALLICPILVCVVAQDSNRFFMFAPNVFRLNVEETVSVQVWTATQVELYLQDVRRTKVINKVTKNLQANKPEIIKLKITEADLPRSWKEGTLHYYLVGKANGVQKETHVLLDFRPGTVFIQTDKPIYKPDEIVKYRIIPVGLDFLPLKGQVNVEIKNPQGIRVRKENGIEAWKKGFASKEYMLGNLAVQGTWTMTAFFGAKGMVNSSTTFAVREYVLPTFQVRIIPPMFIAETTNIFHIKVSAKYSHGKEVKGTVRLRLSLQGARKEIEVDDQDFEIIGEEVFKFKKDQLIEPKEVVSFPIGQKLRISAVVTERATGTKERASDHFVTIVKSPYTIGFEKTVKYFKPDLTFRVMATVRYPDKRPAKLVKVSVEAASNGRSLLTAGVSNDAITNELGDALFTLNVPKIADDTTRISITVKTIMAEVTNAVASLEVEPYRSPNKYYILVRGPMRPPLLGDRVDIQVLIPENVGVTQLNHLVVARGRIVQQGVIRRAVGTESSIRLSITEEMAPTCRIIVYFERKGEVVADSTLMDVQDTLKNQVKLSTDVGMDFNVKHNVAPATTFLLTVEARKESWLGLLAVDQSVYYLRNKSRVTHKKVFDDIGSFDLGCGLGAGRDNRDVFDNAGLAVVTNAQISTSKRNDMTCPGESKSRRRRSVNQLALIKKCCKGKCCDNFFASRVRISPRTKCADLKSRLAPTCWEDFYQCCRMKFEVRGRSIDAGDGDFVVSADDLLEVPDLTVRKEFPESWIWHNLYTGDKDTIHKSFTVPDSLTTWELSAISMNNKTGFGMSKTLELESRKDFFVSIKMPYSVQRREQVTIYAIIYNFNHGRQRANLYFTGHQSFCSIAAPGKKSRRISMEIGGNDAVAIPFTIIPLEIGKSPIQFDAYKDGDGDKIFKTLSVVPEGVQQKETVSFLLDPQGILRNKTKKNDKVIEENRKDSQINSYEMTLPESYVKDSESAMLYVTGNLMTAGVEDMIDKGLENLIRLPTGCGEQTMIRMAPLVYVLRYMYSTKDGVTSAVEKKAYDFLRKGYNQELKWRRTDNSYSVWGQRTPPCTWLTAFVNKVFCQATRYIKDDIDNAVICDSLQFLQSIQQTDGSFKEAYAVRHREMIGGNNGAISLTSFVLISLLECKSQCANANTKVVLQASQFLAKNIPGIKDGYLMSLVSYALVLADSPSKQQAYTKLKGMLVEEIKNGREVNYIKDGGPALKVESTAYTLLTMLKSNEVDSAGPLVIWLTEQRNSKGSFYSTQDTVIALQALSEYSSRTAGGELDLQITVTATRNKDVRKLIKILPQNALVRQQFDISRALPGRINIDTRGKGTAQLQVEITYNKPATDDEMCGYFVQVKTDEEIDIKVNDAPAGATKQQKHKEKRKNCKKIKNKKKKRKCRNRNKKLRNKQKDQVVNKIKVEVCARHKSANGSSMTIFEVGIFTGFEPDKKELKQLKTTNRDPRVDRYEINDRSIVFYLRQVSRVKPSCIRFSLKKTVTVGALQAVPVKVYDYYEPGDACTIFYGPKKGSQLQKPICEGNECQCSQGDCAQKLSTNPTRLKKMACINHDLTFMGVVGQVKNMNTWQRITFKIKSVYKKGKENLNAGDKISVYISSSCEYPSVKVSKQFIVMVKDGNKYLLDNTAAVLEWPEEDAKRDKVQLALNEVKKGMVCDEF